MNINRHTDIIDSESNEPIIVEAEISLLPTNKGGRESPISGKFKYRPNHNFGSTDNTEFYIGQVELNDNEYFHPGETKVLLIIFIDGEGLCENLTIGNEWRLQEGQKLIGKAVVKKIIQKA